MNAPDSDHALLAACRRRRIRMRPERLAVIQALAAASDHPTTEQLHDRARTLHSRVSLPTVYRTLAMLVQHGLVFRFDFGDGQARYEDATRGEHHHLVETDSGDILDLRDPRLDATIAKLLAERGFDSRAYHVEIRCARADGAQPILAGLPSIRAS